MRCRVEASLMQWNSFQEKRVWICVRRRGMGKGEKSSLMLLSRQTYYFSMKQIRKASFQICLLEREPEAHLEMPYQTSDFTPLAVVISLDLTRKAYLLRQSSVKWVSLRQSLALDCQVAKAWSMLVISRKAASFFFFTLLSRCSFSFSKRFYLSNPMILYSLRCFSYWIAFLTASTFTSNSSTLLWLSSMPWKYSFTASALPPSICRITSPISANCQYSAPVRSRKASLPRWNSNSTIFLWSVSSRKCGSTSMRSNMPIFLLAAFCLAQCSATLLLSCPTNFSASSNATSPSSLSSGSVLLSSFFLLLRSTSAAIISKGFMPCRYFILQYMSRPQNQLPPQLWYNTSEASKYESNTRIQTIQRQLAERAIELLDAESGSFVLDIGCGSGISGETLEENGFVWEGMDISRDMLNIAAAKEEMSAGLWQVDIGQGWKFRPGVFDGVISISTIQWLCVAGKKSDNPFKRCCKFFQSLYDCLRIGGRAVLQFYPDGKHQLEMITTAAMKSGFSGGLIVDYPNSTRAKKYYLVIEAGVRRNLGIVQVQGKTQEMDQQEVGEGQGEGQVKVNKQREQKKQFHQKSKKKILKRKQFVVKKKDRLRRRGLATKPDTKYTGRRRKPKF